MCARVRASGPPPLASSSPSHLTHPFFFFFFFYSLRAAAWKADVTGLLIMLGIAVPFVAIHRTLAARDGGGGSSPANAAVASGLVLAVGGAALWRLGAHWPGVPQLAAAAAAAGDGPPSTVAGAVARAGAAGAAVVGLLSGYGAVALPRAHLASFIVPVTARDVAASEAALVRTVELAARKRKAAALAARRHAGGRAGGGGGGGGTASARGLTGLARLNPFSRGGGGGAGDAAAAVALITEAAALDALARELAADALDLRREAARARGAKTLGGRGRNALGYLLSAYCALRVLAAARDLVRGPPPPGAAADPAARLLGGALAGALAALLPTGVPPPSAAEASHYVAVALVGAVGVGSLNGFLRACRRALAAASGSRSLAAPSAAALTLCEVLGLYALSTLLLTARRLPDAHRAAVAAALGGDLDAAPYLTWFNGMLLTGVAGTAVGLAAARALKDTDGLGGGGF